MAEDLKYAVLIDAGSSGSRVYVYQWREEAAGDQHETKIKLVDGYEGKEKNPGLAKLAPEIAPARNYDLDTPAHISEQLLKSTTADVTAETCKRVNEYLGPLIEHARSFVPQDKVRHTGLFVLATGGMRRIKDAQYESYEILCKAVKSHVEKSGFNKPIFETISGEDEGLYGWVAANHLDGRFKPGSKPHGFMELGGESAQFAVSLSGTEAGEYKGFLRMVNIWGEPYAVYVKTWMGVGNDSAWKRHLEDLRQDDSAMPQDPCLPKGYSFRLPGCDKIVQGTGDFKECLKVALSLLNCSNKDCKNGNLCVYHSKKGGDRTTPESVGCLLRDETNGEPLIRFDKQHFCGASVYWHATHGIFRDKKRSPWNSEKQPDNLEALWKTVVEYSKKDWKTLKDENPGEKRNEYKRLRRSFFTAALAMATLFLGFGVPMPKEVIETTRSFARERAKHAVLAADIAVQDAEKRHKVEFAALVRKMGAVTQARKKEADLGPAPDEVPAGEQNATWERLERLKKEYLNLPNESNRDALMNAVPERGGDAHAAANEATRKATEERKKAVDVAKQAYDKLSGAWGRRTDTRKLWGVVDLEARINDRVKGSVEAGARVGDAVAKVVNKVLDEALKSGGVTEDMYKLEIRVWKAILGFEAGAKFGDDPSCLHTDAKRIVAAVAITTAAVTAATAAIAPKAADKARVEAAVRAAVMAAVNVRNSTVNEQMVEAVEAAGEATVGAADKAAVKAAVKDAVEGRVADEATVEAAVKAAVKVVVKAAGGGVSAKVDKKLESMFKDQDKDTKYRSLENADWTLGRIVLHVTKCDPELRTVWGWKGQMKALGQRRARYGGDQEEENNPGEENGPGENNDSGEEENDSGEEKDPRLEQMNKEKKEEEEKKKEEARRKEEEARRKKEEAKKKEEEEKRGKEEEEEVEEEEKKEEEEEES